MEKILAEIQKLGFSPYESKAYLSLLQHSPVTGYELSKRSGVPRSMIYEVINKLVDRGAVQIVPSEPLKYLPVPAREFLNRVRRSMETTLDFLDQSLNSLAQPTEVNMVIRIDGYDKVLDELKSMIERAKQELWLSVWHPQTALLGDWVREAEKRSVRVMSIVYGDADCQLGTTFHHDYMPPEVVQQRTGGKLTIAARDREEVVIANFPVNGACWAVKTHDPVLVLIAMEYIRHDMMLDALIRRYDPEDFPSFWRDHPDLRYVAEGMRSE